MPRKHGAETVLARRARAADDISELLTNPEVAAAVDAIRTHADKAYAAGERLFDANPKVRRVWNYPYLPHQILREHELVAHVLPDRTERPQITVSRVGSLHHKSRRIQIPPQDLLGASPEADGPAEWLDLKVKRGQPLSTRIEEFEAVYLLVGNRAVGATRGIGGGKLTRDLQFYKQRLMGKSVKEIAIKEGISKNTVGSRVRSLISKYNLPNVNEPCETLNICRKCNGDEGSLCPSCPVHALLAAPEPSRQGADTEDIDNAMAPLGWAEGNDD